MRGLLLYAPNVHTGGGLVLLRALLANWPVSGPKLTLFLDYRALDVLPLPDVCRVYWVEASMASRLLAEFHLRRQAAHDDAIVFCFHGLPPILPNKAKIVVYLHNRNYLVLNSRPGFSWRTQIRLNFERLVGRVFRNRVSSYIVQTHTMKRELLAWLNSGRGSHTLPNVLVLPFMDNVPLPKVRMDTPVIYDFVYVADGATHKNHRNLLRAWTLLADDGLRPTLALTLTERDGKLRAEVESAKQARNLSIVDFGNLPHGEVMALYKSSRALIFPSTSESLGLPLIEAARSGLPILAGELDYVRDVCVPHETFNPESPVSIARAVKRFLEGGEPRIILPFSPTVFWDEFLLHASSK